MSLYDTLFSRALPGIIAIASFHLGGASPIMGISCTFRVAVVSPCFVRTPRLICFLHSPQGHGSYCSIRKTGQPDFCASWKDFPLRESIHQKYFSGEICQELCDGDNICSVSATWSKLQEMQHTAWASQRWFCIQTPMRTQQQTLRILDAQRDTMHTNFRANFQRCHYLPVCYFPPHPRNVLTKRERGRHMPILSTKCTGTVSPTQHFRDQPARFQNILFSVQPRECMDRIRQLKAKAQYKTCCLKNSGRQSAFNQAMLTTIHLGCNHSKLKTDPLSPDIAWLDSTQILKLAPSFDFD